MSELYHNHRNQVAAPCGIAECRNGELRGVDRLRRVKPCLAWERSNTSITTVECRARRHGYDHNGLAAGKTATFNGNVLGWVSSVSFAKLAGRKDVPAFGGNKVGGVGNV